jgi:hypothetical protein
MSADLAFEIAIISLLVMFVLFVVALAADDPRWALQACAASIVCAITLGIVGAYIDSNTQYLVYRADIPVIKVTGVRISDGAVTCKLVGTDTKLILSPPYRLVSAAGNNEMTCSGQKGLLPEGPVPLNTVLEKK